MLVISLIVAAAVVAAATLFVGRPGVEVRVAEHGSGRILWRRAVGPGGVVALQYRHSVERTPITEVFRAEPDGLRFLEMRFVSQGAGLPTEGYVREGDSFVLRRERWVGVLPIRVSAVSGHQLILGDDRLDLVALAGDGAGLSITSGAGRRVRLPGGP